MYRVAFQNDDDYCGHDHIGDLVDVPAIREAKRIAESYYAL